MTLREKDPLVPDPDGRDVDVGVDDRLLFALLCRVCRGKRLALEVAVPALPDLVRVVHSIRPRLDFQPALEIVPDRPCAFAEAPVVVLFGGAAGHLGLPGVGFEWGRIGRCGGGVAEGVFWRLGFWRGGCGWRDCVGGYYGGGGGGGEGGDAGWGGVGAGD